MSSKTIDEMSQELEELQGTFDEKKERWFDDWFVNNPDGGDLRYYLQGIDDFYDENREILNKIKDLQQTIRMNMDYTLSDLSTYGDVMTLKDFIDEVKSGGFINYDGFGRYVKDNKETNIEIYPSDVKNNAIRTEFTEIIWFNK